MAEDKSEMLCRPEKSITTTFSVDKSGEKLGINHNI